MVCVGGVDVVEPAVHRSVDDLLRLTTMAAEGFPGSVGSRREPSPRVEI